MTTTLDRHDFDTKAVLRLREDLALALRAAAHHGLAEGARDRFSVGAARRQAGPATC